MNAFVFQDLGHGANQRVCIAGPEREEDLSQTPVRTNGREYLLMLHLAGHDRGAHALALEGIDEFSQISERKPVNGRCPAGLNERRSFLFDSGYNYLGALSAGSIEQEQRETAVSGNQAKFLLHSHFPKFTSAQFRRLRHLKGPFRILTRE